MTVLKSQSVYPDIEPPADAAPLEASTPEVYSGGLDEYTNWQNAHDRVLLYLRSLNMPPILGLSIALDVLRRQLKSVNSRLNIIRREPPCCPCTRC
jgi:hypothetical protein